MASMVREASCCLPPFDFFPFVFSVGPALISVGPALILVGILMQQPLIYGITFHAAAHANMLLAYVKPCDTAMNVVLKLALFFLSHPAGRMIINIGAAGVFELDHPAL